MMHAKQNYAILRKKRTNWRKLDLDTKADVLG